MEHRHVSPDGLLHLVVERDGDDTSIGFQGFPWHTHADILGDIYQINEEDAMRQFVQNVISDKSYICVLRKSGTIVDVWVTDDPSQECVNEDETLEIRRWSSGQQPA